MLNIASNSDNCTPNRNYNNLIEVPILNHENRRLSYPDLERHPLSFFLSNVRSLLPQVDELDAILKLNHTSLAFITETWLNENIDDDAVQIPGYSLIRRDRNYRSGGGVCAYIKSTDPL